MSGLTQRLIGSWRLVDCKIVQGETVRDLPLGPAENCGGLLIYAPERTMSVMLSTLDRPPFKDGSVHEGTPQEMAHAYQTIVSYTGTFTVDDETSKVTHHVMYSTFPDWIGRDQVRMCTLEADALRLDALPMRLSSGEEQASYLAWKRIGAQA